MPQRLQLVATAADAAPPIVSPLSDDIAVARGLGDLVVETLANVPGPARQAVEIVVQGVLEGLADRPASPAMAQIIADLSSRIGGGAESEPATAALQRALQLAAERLNMSDQDADRLARRIDR